jgi:hypothetical protein
MSEFDSDDARALRWLRDRAAIGDRLARLARALDDCDPGGVEQCVTEGCEWDVDPSVAPVVGRAAITALVRAGGPAENAGDHRTNTQLSNIMCEIDGDTACTDAYLFMWVAQPELGAGFIWGRWRDQLVRDGETWRISSHRVHVLEQENTQLAGHPVVERRHA